MSNGKKESAPEAPYYKWEITRIFFTRPKSTLSYANCERSILILSCIENHFTAYDVLCTKNVDEYMHDSSTQRTLLLLAPVQTRLLQNIR